MLVQKKNLEGKLHQDIKKQYSSKMVLSSILYALLIKASW